MSALRRAKSVLATAAFALLINVPHAVADLPSAGLNHGFLRLYDLDFSGGQREFESWEKLNPDDPMGPASEAAGILFSEFNRLGVLEAQFYEDDSIFAARQKYVADPAQRARFEQRLSRAEDLAKARLSRDPRDRDALLAMTLTNGLRSDFAALIEKRNLASLHYTKEATAWAQQLLTVDPTCYDAHLASGVSRYIIGSMAAPVRWILRFGGVSGDKAARHCRTPDDCGAGPPPCPIRAHSAGHCLCSRERFAARSRTPASPATRLSRQHSLWPGIGAARQERQPLTTWKAKHVHQKFTAL